MIRVYRGGGGNLEVIRALADNTMILYGIGPRRSRVFRFIVALEALYTASSICHPDMQHVTQLQ